jgi:hypothetical protein
MKHGLLAAVAAAALVTAGGAFAQTKVDPGQPTTGGQGQSPAAQDSKQKSMPGQAQSGSKAEPRGQAQGQGGAQVQGQGGAQMKTEPGQPTTGGQGKSPAAQQDTKQPMQGQAQDRAGQKGDTAQSKSDTKSVQLNQEQRTKISQTIKSKDVNLRSVNRTEINFQINVGAVVPRTVTLYPLPAPIVAVVPAYRGYLYIVVDGDLIIIHPQTYEIVAVIQA